MSNLDLIKITLIPLISALIGWLTNWIAIKMLFHPKKPVKVLFYTFHGLFYKKQKQLATNLSNVIEKKLISHNDIKEILTSETFIAHLKPIIDQELEKFIQEKLMGIHPMMAMIPGDFLELIRSKLTEEIQLLLPKLLESAQTDLENILDIKNMVREKIENFNVGELEDILFTILKNEFKHVEYLGGIVGFVIGLVQVILIYAF